jgi:hypothetical protein
VYLKRQDAEHGELRVSNARHEGELIPTPNPTPLRSIGLHTITRVDTLGNGQWRMTVAGSPWQAPGDSLDGLGLVGLTVDLNAADEAGPLYRVVSNLANSLVVEPGDGPLPAVGQELIGVVTVERLAVSGGAVVATEDRLVALDPAGPTIGSQSSLSVHELGGGALATLLPNLEGSTLEVEAATSFGNLVLDAPGGTLVLNGATTVTGNLTVANDSTLQAVDLSVLGSVLVDSGTLAGAEMVVGGDLTLLNEAVLSVPEAGTHPLHVHTLDLNVTGNILVDEFSRIDLDGKGYPPGTSFPDFGADRIGCHGGVRYTGESGCVYGDFREARFAGSGGRQTSSTAPGAGGGAARIQASTVTLNGELTADGTIGYWGGAGGAVNLLTERLTGAGSISANGERSSSSVSYPSGGGGRISVVTSIANDFSLDQFSAMTSASGLVSGAGTIYLRDADNPYGHLVVDNGGRTAEPDSTPLPGVGRHVITAVDPLGEGRWRVTVSGTPWRASEDTADGLDIVGLEVDLDASDDAGPLYRVVDNDQSSIVVESIDALSAPAGQELTGVITLQRLTVDGRARVSTEDRVVLLDPAGSRVTGYSVLSVGAMDAVSFDQLFPNLDTGRLELQQPLATDELIIAGAGASLTFKGGVQVAGDLVLDGDGITLSTGGPVQVGGAMSLLNGARLTVPDADSSSQLLYTLDIDVAGQLEVDALSAIDVSEKGYPMRYTAGFTRISGFIGGSHGGVGGYTSGYPPTPAYGDFIEPTHAGAGGDQTAGGGVVDIHAASLVLDGAVDASGADGSDMTGAGGSIRVRVDGALSGTGAFIADGGATTDTSNPNGSGGGGRIGVVYGDRTGFAGTFSATAGASWYDETYPLARGGAGTVYLRQSDAEYGELIADNSAGGLAQPTQNGATLRAVGRQTIASLEPEGTDRWRIRVEGAPWQAPADAPDGLGIVGLMVDLDAGPFYQVVDNDASSLVVVEETGQDLSETVSAGDEFVGVITLQRLQVNGGARLSTGDRLVLVDVAGSSIAPQSALAVDSLTDEAFTSFLDDLQGGLEVNTPVALNELALDSNGASLVVHGGLTVTDFVAMGNSTTLQAVELTVGGELQMLASTLVTGNSTIGGNVALLSGSVITVPDPGTDGPVTLRLDVGGGLVIDATSRIDVDGKGYPVSTSYPGSDYGCHGGARYGASTSCVYGRYPSAGFPGSGGSTYSYYADNYPGFGGGAVRITAGAVTLAGEISADGQLGYYTGGAGGAVHLDVASLSGSGRIKANAGDTYPYSSSSSYRSGAGGRISVYTAAGNSFVPTQYAAATGTTYRNFGGAGTVFVRDGADGYGHLMSDNGGRLALSGSTPIEAGIGQHVIADVVDLGSGRWEVFRGTPPGVDELRNGSITSSGTGSVAYEYFSVPVEQEIVIEVTQGSFDSQIYLFRDDGSLDSGDYVTTNDDGGVGLLSKIQTILPAGDYVLAIGAYSLSQSEAISGLNSSSSGTYTLAIESVGGGTSSWPSTDTVTGAGLQGYHVDLDASTVEGPYYRIVSSTESSFVVETSDDLSIYTGSQLIGVHPFDTLTVTGGAKLEFINEPVFVQDVANSTVEVNSEVLAPAGSVLP